MSYLTWKETFKFVNDDDAKGYLWNQWAAATHDLAAANERLREAEKDAQRFQYLQNLPKADAQAFFWNFDSRKQRAAAIDAALAGAK